jgi:hypothetical protein
MLDDLTTKSDDSVQDLITLLVFGNSEEGLQTAKYLNLHTSQAIHYKTATELLCLHATEFEGKLT